MNDHPEAAWPLPLDAAEPAARRPSSTEAEVIRLFDELRAPLLRYLRSFGLPVCDGEEVVQEVFLALFHHLRGGRPRHNLRGWLFKVAHNLGLKRRGSCASTESIDAHEASLTAAATQEGHVAFLQQRRRIAAVVIALPEQDRRCLSLRAEGLGYREIAGVLEISLGSVSNSLARSLARIARALER